MELMNEVEKYLNTKNYHVDHFFKIYSFANENIDGYMQYFDLREKSLLTVGSSCDQLLNANLNGCNDITVCDICPLVEYYYYLKLASILTFDREELLYFLCRTKYKDNREYNPHLFTKKNFRLVKDTLKSLDYESHNFWEYIFENYSREFIELLFQYGINSSRSITYCNRYLKNDYNYNQLKKTISNLSVSFINDDITSFKIDRTFDNIWLSNVAHYIEEDQISEMINHNIDMLSSNGQMLISYFWSKDMTIKGFPIKALLNSEYKQKIVSGAYDKKYKDSILVYRKI